MTKKIYAVLLMGSLDDNLHTYAKRSDAVAFMRKAYKDWVAEAADWDEVSPAKYEEDHSCTPPTDDNPYFWIPEHGEGYLFETTLK